MNSKYDTTYQYPVNTDTKAALVVFSGGQDSTTCLKWAIDNFDEVHALTINYGQRHSEELNAARTIYKRNKDYVVSHETLNVGKVLKGTSPLVNDEEELELYADAESLPGGLEKTFVPMRNQFFLTLAANVAYVKGIRNLVTGICQADSGGYPDCREDFKNSLQTTINLGTFTGEPGTIDKLKIHAPLMHLTKAQSIELAIDVGAYVDLMWSHTAYDGNYPPVSNDHANLLREHGFKEAGLPDPLVLRAVYEGLMPLPTSDNYSNSKIPNLDVPRNMEEFEDMILEIADTHAKERNMK